jgi:21S rRNA (GM2251-2'-O)-methyltransferase
VQAFVYFTRQTNRH